MKVRRILIILLITLILAVALLFGLADRVPAAYRDAQQRVTRLAELNEQAMREGLPPPRRHFVQICCNFSEYGGAGKPFAFEVTSDEINLCLVSMDQIASLRPGKPVCATAKLAKAGFRGPLISLDDGVLTLMVKSIQYDKIISVDLKFVFDSEGDMRMEILAIRVGVLPVPKAWVEGRIGQLRERMQDLLGKANGSGGDSPGDPTKDAVRLLRAVVKMLDGATVHPKITWRGHPLLITDVVVDDGKLTLHFEPIPD